MNDLHCTFLIIIKENSWIRVQFIHMGGFSLFLDSFWFRVLRPGERLQNCLMSLKET